MRRLVVFASCIALAVATYVLLFSNVGWQIAPTDPAAVGSVPGVPTVAVPQSREIDITRRALPYELPHLTSVGALESIESDRDAAPTNLTKDESWTRYRRARFDLAGRFRNTPDVIAVDDLVRHVQLSVPDKVLSTAEIADLQSIVTVYRKKLEPMLDAWRSERAREIQNAIESGVIQPLSTASQPVPEARAIRLAEEAQRQGQLPPGVTLDEAVALFRKSSIVSGSAAIVGDRNYPLSSFPSLPRSDGMYDEIGFEAINYLGAVVCWFESKGLVRPAEIIGVLEAASKLTAAAARGVPRK